VISGEIPRDSCTSYIRQILQEYPKIRFYYKEFHTDYSNRNHPRVVVDFEIEGLFAYSESRDVTNLEQLQDIESKIDFKKPVILKTIVTIVPGDARTKNKLEESWTNFASISTQRTSFACDGTGYSLARKLDIESYKQEVMLYWDTARTPNWWMSVSWYWTFVFLLLALPYKAFFTYATQRVTVHIKKFIYSEDAD
jgi:hypothetical protein